jgi:hypothetical protein
MIMKMKRRIMKNGRRRREVIEERKMSQKCMIEVKMEMQLICMNTDKGSRC